MNIHPPPQSFEDHINDMVNTKIVDNAKARATATDTSSELMHDNRPEPKTISGVDVKAPPTTRSGVYDPWGDLSETSSIVHTAVNKVEVKAPPTQQQRHDSE